MNNDGLDPIPGMEYILVRTVPFGYNRINDKLVDIELEKRTIVINVVKGTDKNGKFNCYDFEIKETGEK